MSAHRTLAVSQSLTWAPSSRPTYWIGLLTRGSSSSNRGHTVSTAMRSPPVQLPSVTAGARSPTTPRERAPGGVTLAARGKGRGGRGSPVAPGKAGPGDLRPGCGVPGRGGAGPAGHADEGRQRQEQKQGGGQQAVLGVGHGQLRPRGAGGRQRQPYDQL